MRSKQQADLRIASLDFFDIFLLLRHAAAQCNDDLGPSFFQVAQRTDIAERAVFCVLAYCTGVEEDKIRFVCIFGHRITHLAQHAADVLGIRLVLLAAECMGIGAQLFAVIH